MFFESNRTRLALLRYLPLVFIFFSLISMPFYFTQFSRYWFQILQSLFFSGLFFFLFTRLKNKLRYVMLTDDAIFIDEGANQKKYAWSDVQFIEQKGSFYRMQLKDMESTVWFPSSRIFALFSNQLTPMGMFIIQKKLQYQI